MKSLSLWVYTDVIIISYKSAGMDHKTLLHDAFRIFGAGEAKNDV